MKTWITRRPLLAAAVVSAVIAVAMWVTGAWVPMSARDDRADLTAAGTLTLVAVVCAVTRRVITVIRESADGLMDRDKELLVRGLIDVSQRAAKAPTVPLARLRVMNRRLAPPPALL